MKNDAYLREASSPRRCTTSPSKARSSRAVDLAAHGNHVLLKREDKQPVFSFKLRGAYNKMANLKPAELARGVICACAGNHAQGVALAAQRLGDARPS